MSSESDTGNTSGSDLEEDGSSSNEDIDLTLKNNDIPPAENDQETIAKYQNKNVISALDEMILDLNVPTFEDVTPMINSKIPFLIDGDALLMYAFLQEYHEITFGGQFLHVVYFCERFLKTFADKGGNFIIVFFDIWETYWGKNSNIRCLRLSLHKHLQNFTNYRLYRFASFVDPKFKEFIHLVKPRCVLLDISYHISMKEFHERVSTPSELIPNVEDGVLTICAEITFFRANDLPCIDICGINVEVSTISSFNLPSNPTLLHIAKVLCVKLSNISSLPFEDDKLTVQCNYSGYDARRCLVIIASKPFLVAIEDTNVLKLILLTYASLEVLYLEHRCCPKVKHANAFLQNIVLKWLNCLSCAFEYCLENEIELEWENIGDIWQGTMFSYICYIVQNTISSGSELGQFQEAYEHYIECVRRECNIELDEYPINPLSKAKKIDLLTREECNENDEVNLYLLNNPLSRSFCGDAFQDVNWRQPLNPLKVQEFDEVKHWHCAKPLTDDYDRIKETQLWTDDSDRKWRDKQKAYMARFLEVYSRNLEGGSNKSQAIVYQNKDIAPKKIHKERKKVSDLKEKIKNEKEQVNLKKEEEVIKELKLCLKRITDTKQKLENVNRVRKRLTVKETILSIDLLKLKVYKEQFKNMKPADMNLDIVKETFLIIRSILQDHTAVKEKDKIFLSKLLHELGFGEIAKRNNLPTDITFKEVFNLNWVRFQLEHLGPQMKRVTDCEYDPDIGFTPDLWQTKFIDAIRKNKSALVVAPTSSGKTFAAYYCMKRILKESEDGIVVYVSPTKALVNQVEATVYARFKNTKLRDGKSVVGIFTRDYRRNAMNARILVTVPQCLDIFLLSPRRYSWLQNVKYVIFDEVHKLTGNIEGLVWERCLLMIRCPFVALSATVSDVSEFHGWLVANEMFKQEQDREQGRMRDSYDVVLVEHTERYTDLKKHIYNAETGLQHYHPYHALDAKVMQEHDGIPSTLHISPPEVIQLYDVMNSKDSVRSKFTEQRDIFNFFSSICTDGFINRNDVNKYEKIISKIFNDLHKEDKRTSLDIIRQLGPEKSLSTTPDKHEMISLLHCMAERNFLPCIVFSYNRNVIERTNYETTEECRKNEKVGDDRRTQKANEKLAKMEKKVREKEEGTNKDKTSGRVTKSSYILRVTGSKFKGEGIADSDDLKLVERRLPKTQANRHFRAGLPYGVAYHHGGLNNKERSTVEILFRMGIAKVVFATGTLALGIHMPCKSVVIYGDSTYLNSLEYHQMSGRAGRRGFDLEGNVIFLGLSERRQNMLMTDKLPKMLGNFPVSVTLVARLLLLVTKVTDKNKSSKEATNITLSRAVALLENSLIFKFNPNLKVQIKHFVDFTAQLLFIQGLYSADGSPLQLASIVNHLHYHEPANLVFAYLFRTGAIREFISSIGNRLDIEWGLIIVLSHLFARLKLHRTNADREYKNSVVILEPLPEQIVKAVSKYNWEVRYIFNNYYISVASHLKSSLGKDDTLPVSRLTIMPLYSSNTEEKPGCLSAKIKSACVERVACSNFSALSGNDDTNLYTGTAISNIKHEICSGIQIVPLLDTDVILNSYAADFYRHGIVEAIKNDNGLKAGFEFDRLKDFMLVLKSLVMCLEEMEPVNDKDIVYTYFRNISIKFESKFKKAFNI